MLGSRKHSFHMVAELVILRATRSLASDATAENLGAATASDGGDPTATVAADPAESRSSSTHPSEQTEISSVSS